MYCLCCISIVHGKSSLATVSSIGLKLKHRPLRNNVVRNYLCIGHTEWKQCMFVSG